MKIIPQNRLSMDFFGGMDFCQILCDGKNYSIKFLLKILLDICRKISFLHDHSIYILDICPDNILINDTFEVKLSDFEYAVQDNFENIDLEVGTPGFCANLQLLEEASDVVRQRLIYKDIYALGNILLACYDRTWYINCVNTKKSVLNTDYISKSIHKLPKDVQSICLRTNLMVPNRYSTVEHLIQDIESLSAYE